MEARVWNELVSRTVYQLCTIVVNQKGMTPWLTIRTFLLYPLYLTAPFCFDGEDTVERGGRRPVPPDHGT